MSLTPEDVRRIAQEVYRTNNIQSDAILSQFAFASNGPNGFLSAGKTTGQSVNNNPLTNMSNNTAFLLPLPVIYGSSFNGGDAPNGAAILLVSGLKVQLWVRAYDSVAAASRWYGVDFTSTNVGSNAKVLGPIA